MARNLTLSFFNYNSDVRVLNFEITLKYLTFFRIITVLKSKSKVQGVRTTLTPKSLVAVTDMDIKPINKRASGQAFEVILKPPSPVSEVSHCITSPPKRDISLEDIQKKLEAAEDRRRVRMFSIIFIIIIIISAATDHLVLLKATPAVHNKIPSPSSTPGVIDAS